MSESLEQRFTDFKRQLDRLPDPTEPPATTLQILGRGQQEQDWQRLLFYFLSPDKAHGLGHALLKQLLTAFANRDDLSFDFSRFDLHDIQVETEVTTADGRRPDAVMWSGEDWFICWELKVRASEGIDQTIDYVETESFRSIGLEKEALSTDRHHYIYLAPDSASPPRSGAFASVSWEWLADQLESFLAESHGSYPARTTAQLNDFISNIRSELIMTDYQENQEEKSRLYFEYYDEIAEAKAAFENEWAEFANTWGTQLTQTLDTGDIVVIPELADTNVAIECQTATENPECWIFRQEDSDWAGIVKDGWWRHEDDLSRVYAESEDRNDFRLGLYHRLEENRELAAKDHVLELQLWHGTGNSDQFMYDFKEELEDSIQKAGSDILPAAELTGSRGNPVVMRYDIPAEEYDDFFEAYILTVKEAFIEIVVEHSELVKIVDQTYEKLLEAHN